MTVRIKLHAQFIGSERECRINKHRSSRYKKVTWGVLRYPPCAVVGGGHSVRYCLDALRKWPGDIFAINDTSAYLSDNGIPCYLYAIDTTKTPFRIGENVKGAIMATRCHRNQFKQFKEEQILTFDMAEEDHYGGIEGGPTAVCRTAHLFLRMGYQGIYYFGIDGSFEGQSHVNGNQAYAYEKMIVVHAGDRDYLSNGALMLQNDWMLDSFKKYPKFLHNCSAGLIRALLENPDTWEVVAVSKDLRDEFEEKGITCWNKEYTFSSAVHKPIAATA